MKRKPKPAKHMYNENSLFAKMRSRNQKQRKSPPIDNNISNINNINKINHDDKCNNKSKPVNEKDEKQLIPSTETNSISTDNLQDLDKLILNKVLDSQSAQTWGEVATLAGVDYSTLWRHKKKVLTSHPVLREQLGLLAAGDLGYWYRKHKTEKGMDSVKTAYELAGVYERKPAVQVNTQVINVQPEQLEERLEWIKKNKERRKRLAEQDGRDTDQ